MSFLKKERSGTVLVLTMDHPATRNALTGNTAVEEFVQACAEIQADRSIRVVILTGEGPVFSSGGNVKDMQRYFQQKLSPEIIREEYRNGIQRLPRALYNLDVPVIAAVNGPAIGAGIEQLFKPNTKLVHTEAPGSNTFEMQDIPAIAAIAHKHGAVVAMDNTWATPVYFRPLDFGVDISIHAATKYPAGHSDILMGTVSANAKHWEQLKEANITLGICGAPDDAYQVLRGLRTMGIRLERHYESALAVAKWLEGREEVAKVLHPALPSFKGHDIWKRDFKGASGIFSFVLKADSAEQFKPKAHAFLDALSIFGLGWSWGGFECLAVHVNLNDRRIAKAPEGGPLIRLQIGLEDVADIKADIERGFAASNAV